MCSLESTPFRRTFVEAAGRLPKQDLVRFWKCQWWDMGPDIETIADTPSDRRDPGEQEPKADRSTDEHAGYVGVPNDLIPYLDLMFPPEG